MASEIRKKMGPLRKRLMDNIEKTTKIMEEPETTRISEIKDKIERLEHAQSRVNTFYAQFKTLNEKLFEIAQEVEAEKVKVEEEAESVDEIMYNADEAVAESSIAMKSLKARIAKEKQKERVAEERWEKLHNMDMEKLKAENNNLKAELQKGHGSQLKEGCVRLPKIDLQKFSGDILQFQTFWDSFQSSVGNNKSLNAIDKFNYLRLNLEGEAKMLVDGLELTNSNYDVAVDLLLKRYCNKRKVVNARYKAILDMKSSSNNPKSLRNTYDALNVHLRALEAQGEDTGHNFVVFVIWNKLPGEVKIYLGERNFDWSIVSLRKELDIYINSRCDNASEVKESASFVNSKSTVEALVVNERTRLFTKKCVFCKSDTHWSDQCDKFPTIAERKSVLKGSCFRCLQILQPDHRCKMKRTCVYCKSDLHHRSFCPHQFKDGQEIHTTAAESGLLATGEKVIMQTARALMHGNNRSVEIRLMFDGGSQRSYITERLADTLGLERRSPKSLSVLTFGSEKPVILNTSTVEASISLKDGSVMPLRFDVVPQITGKLTRTNSEILNCYNLKENWPSIMQNLADSLPEEGDSTSASIEVLIGNDYYWEMITGERIEISKGLYFVKSSLGWIVTGRTNEIIEKSNESCMLLLTAKKISDVFYNSSLTCNESEKVNVEDFWKLETLGINDDCDKNDDEEAYAMFQESVTYRENRYYVGWPWKCENPNLHNNYFLALGRLKSLHKRLMDTPNILRKYNEIIQDQIDKGVIECVRPGINVSERIHYVPHHAVITPKKTTTKVRVVYDASSKTRAYKSLNECLYRGPVILEDLCALLMRFRLEKIALVADIATAIYKSTDSPVFHLV